MFRYGLNNTFTPLSSSEVPKILTIQPNHIVPCPSGADSCNYSSKSHLLKITFPNQRSGLSVLPLPLTATVQPFHNPPVGLGKKMVISHGIRTLGVLGAGQMGTGIAMVSALRAKVPVLLYDRSSEQIAKGLSLIDKLLGKDVGKGRLSNEHAKEARDRISVVSTEQGINGLKDVDMVIEVGIPHFIIIIIIIISGVGGLLLNVVV